jgi:hypothetical protein
MARGRARRLGTSQIALLKLSSKGWFSARYLRPEASLARPPSPISAAGHTSFEKESRAPTQCRPDLHFELLRVLGPGASTRRPLNKPRKDGSFPPAMPIAAQPAIIAPRIFSCTEPERRPYPFALECGDCLLRRRHLRTRRARTADRHQGGPVRHTRRLLSRVPGLAPAPDDDPGVQRLNGCSTIAHCSASSRPCFPASANWPVRHSPKLQLTSFNRQRVPLFALGM